METREYIARRIKELRTQKLEITADKLGTLLNPVRSGKTIGSWETARTEPDADMLWQLSRVFSVPISSFYPPSQPSPLVRNYSTSSEAYTEAPLFGSIAAGTPLTVIPIEDTRPLPLEVYRKYPQGFFLKVDGESMNNVLPHGSYALIDPSQNEPVNGGVFAFCLDTNDAAIKRVKKLAHGLELLPDSKDPTFKPHILDYAQEESRQINILGRVVWMMLPFDWEF
jgi:repressor LexA